MSVIPIFPLPGTVVFPGMTIPLYVFEARYKRLVRYCLEQEATRFVITLSKPKDALREADLPFQETGTFVQLLHSTENADGTFNILGHAQERCRIKIVKEELLAEPDGSARPLFFTEASELTLKRSDPNLERVAAWDALDAFRSYAKTFFAFDAVKNLEELIPEDLLYEASFICANIRIDSEARQRLLETPSLLERFKLAQQFIEARLAAHKPVKEDSNSG